MEVKDVVINQYLNVIVAKFNNSRLIIYPNDHKIILQFKRLITQEEKENDKFQTAGFEIDNKIVVTSIGLTPDVLEVLSKIYIYYGKEIKVRQINNDIVREEARPEGLEIMNNATEAELDELTGYYEEDNGNLVCLHLDTIKRRLVLDGIMEQKQGDHFGNPLI
jgi:hypothetical protein